MKKVATTIVNTTSKRPIPTKRIARLANIIFSGEHRTGSVNIILIGDKRMRTLNSRFRGRSETTDVLSFSFDDDDEGDQPPPLIGEVYVSIPQAEKQARTAKHTLSDEILFLISHGLLHLLGYTHETEKRYEQMIDRQITYLNMLHGKL